MRCWGLQLLAGYGIWHIAQVRALAPQPGHDSNAGKMSPATSAIIPQTNGPNLGFEPLPTPRPLFPDNALDLRKRQANTGEVCGYASGDANSPFGCRPSSTCRTDTRLSIIHCCPATLRAGASCIPATTCLDSTAYSSIVRTATTTDPIPFGTAWCTATQYPYCVQMIYGEVPIQGFSWIQCGGQPTRYAAIVSTTEANPTSTQPTQTSVTPITTPPIITPTPVPSPPPNPTPTGAIVGGVVGGLAVIGLVILGLFYLNRRKRNPPEPPAPQQPEVGYAPGPDSPPIGSYGAPADYRGSMFKSPYETPSIGSPPTSPTFNAQSGDNAGTGITQYNTPPPNQGVHYQTPSPPAGAGIAQPQPQPQPQPQVQPQYQPVTQYPPPANSGNPHQSPVNPDQTRYELPTERGDGQLRELRG
ncbi:hypothetical protein B0T18DRAFT_168068 [Schizothecium vesticola]|uniref:Mid2 domain-containing protein n=1 Tax=Schizothecium vesticola TaxID=314040 RepID=A0AA40K1R8_9PEZI|nr:hypothetical protein B0T18DRAFT_168068 [Schizothecium vesticola]